MVIAPKPPTATIAAQHTELLESLPFANDSDTAAVDRGFLGAMEPGVVRGGDGEVGVGRRLARLSDR